MRAFIYVISRSIFAFLLKILFKLRHFKKYPAPKPPYIIASNHASFLDPALVGVVCDEHSVRFMAKKELFSHLIFFIWAKSIGVIEVKRGENSTAALKEALKCLKKGNVVGIFPEGTRSADGSLQDAKRGTGFLISKANVPVVPVYIDGSGTAFPKGFKPKFGSLIRVYTGKAIFPSEFPPDFLSGKVDYDGISNLVMERIAELKYSVARTSDSR